LAPSDFFSLNKLTDTTKTDKICGKISWNLEQSGKVCQDSVKIKESCIQGQLNTLSSGSFV
jgi:hypothetical protein